MSQERYEYIVKRNTDRGLMSKKLWCILGYIALAFAMTVICVRLLYGSLLVIPAAVMAVGVEVLVIFFSWRFTNVEFESSIADGTLSICTIRAGMHRKLSFERNIDTFTEIGLFSADASDMLGSRQLHKNDIFISSLTSDNIYYAIYTEDNETHIVYFEALPDAFSYIKRINRSAVRRSELEISKYQDKSQDKSL